MPIIACPQCGSRNRVNEDAAKRGRPVCGKCGAALSDITTRPQVVTDSTFAREVIEASSTAPVLVDAWAAWCGPCRMIAPILDQLAAESGGRYKIAKLNIDENPIITQQFGIRSIPTLLIFKNGGLVDQIVGAQPRETIAARLAAAAPGS